MSYKTAKKYTWFEGQTYPCSPIIQATNFTPLMVDVLNNDIESARNNLVYINAKNSEGWTALHIAARNSNRHSSNDMVKFLLDNGAMVDNVDNENFTPLCRAVYNALWGGDYVTLSPADCDSSVETVALLLIYGANPYHIINSESNVDIIGTVSRRLNNHAVGQLHNGCELIKLLKTPKLELLEIYDKVLKDINLVIEKITNSNDKSSEKLDPLKFLDLDLEISKLNIEISKLQEILKLKLTVVELKNKISKL